MLEENGSKKSKLDQKSIGLGWRLGLEFVSGVVVGLVLGYVVDQVFLTKPWGMVVFIILGAGAGFLNIYKLAKAEFEDKEIK